jgi:hypothetical protein
MLNFVTLGLSNRQHGDLTSPWGPFVISLRALFKAPTQCRVYTALDGMTTGEW